MNKLSVVISAFNEEKNIEDCLKSVTFAKEIILIDNESTDNTAIIAKRYTDKIFSLPNNLMLNINKNAGFSKATGEWILNLDADERVTPELEEEISNVLGNSRSKINGYSIPRKNIIFGKWIQHGLWWPDYQLRLFKKGKGRFPEEEIHEHLKVEGDTEKLSNPITHYNYNSIYQYLDKMNRIYTENGAELYLKTGKRVTWREAITMPANDFLKTYFLQSGYKDGLHGLILSLLQAFYAEVVFAKAWEKKGFLSEKIELSEFNNEVKKHQKAYRYWITKVKADESQNLLEKIYYRLLHKLAK